MKIDLRNLPRHLKDNPLAPIWLVSGDEPLLVQETLDLLRAQFKAQGATERIVFHIEPGFNWQEVKQTASAVSLFGDKRIVELRFTTSIVNKNAAAGILACLTQAGDDLAVLVSMPKMAAGRQANTSKTWYPSLIKKGIHVPIWPVPLNEMQSWLADRINKAGLKLAADALALMAERVEGHLLAANQEITKLKLLDTQAVWSANAINNIMRDSSQYNAYDLADAVAAGDMQAALKRLNVLKHEAVSPLAILGVLRRQLVVLQTASRAIKQGESANSALRSQGVFSMRMSIMMKALRRLNTNRCESLLARLAWVDQSVKGMILEDPWIILRNLVINCTDHRPTRDLASARQQLHWRF